MSKKIDESLNPSGIFQKFLFNVKTFLHNDKKDYVELSNKQLVQWDRNIYLSRSTDINKTKEEPGNINLFQQFYINKIDERQNEIRKTLLYNCNNNLIDNIYLLNERIYSDEELGVKSDKIKQIVIDKRMTYQDIFTFVENNNIDGYIIISNSDIFFDKSINNIQKCQVIKDKKVYCLNRFNFDSKNLSTLDLDLSGRPDCQDVWIYHSKFNNILFNKDIFDIELGTPGCDNKIIYLFKLLGFNCYNEPEIIKSYHFHKIMTRNYDQNTKRPNYPYYAIFPVLKHDYIDNCRNKFDYLSFDINEENKKIYDYILTNINNNKKFIIPQITIPDNNLAFTGVVLSQNKNNNDFEKFKEDLKVMVDRFVNINSLNDIQIYSRIYLETFHRCNTYIKWEPWGSVYSNTSQSHYFIEKNFVKNTNLWGESFYQFYNIHNNPWSISLKGKKLLIISEFNNIIREKINNREKIYGIDLYPECEFIFIDLTEDDKKLSYDTLLKKIFNNINNLSDKFDIALLSCGGLSNLILSTIDDIGKSGIVVNSFLEISFGIYNSDFEERHQDIIKLYKNDYWTKF
tara:strand:- start:777 stop:2489 length:1713 start_codon:yes stop_codon:yes gene_type:complete